MFDQNLACILNMIWIVIGWSRGKNHIKINLKSHKKTIIEWNKANKVRNKYV